MSVFTVNYPGTKRKNAQRDADKALVTFAARGYQPLVATWVENRRGCMTTLFGTWMIPPGGVLTVTYSNEESL